MQKGIAPKEENQKKKKKLRNAQGGHSLEKTVMSAKGFARRSHSQNTLGGSKRGELRRKKGPKKNAGTEKTGEQK